MKIFDMITKFINLIITYIVNGVLIIVPFILTWYVISSLVKIFNKTIGMGMPFGGIVVIFFIIMLVGYFAKSFFVKLLYGIVELIIMRIPGLSFLYSSVKDFTFAFIDKKVKFDRPVLICINVAVEQSKDIKKIGFITNENLNDFELNDHVAVFVPQSFSFSLSGEFLLIPKKNLIPINNVDCAQIMRFVVTAGFVDSKIKKED